MTQNDSYVDNQWKLEQHDISNKNRMQEQEIKVEEYKIWFNSLSLWLFSLFFLHNNTYLSLILLINSEVVDNSKKTVHLCICNKKVRNILRCFFFFLIFLCAAYMSIAIRKQIYTSGATRKQKAVIRILEHSNNFSTNRKIYRETIVFHSFF